MPDFNIVTAWECSSLESTVANVGGYAQSGLSNERHYPECTCQAYKYGKRVVNFGGQMYPEFCKHILEAEKQICGWHSMYSDEVMTESGICPRCGEKAVPVHVAV